MDVPVRRTLDDKLEPSRCCLLVVDVQNDFCARDGFFGRIGNDLSAVPGMMARLHPLIDAARTAGALVIFVQAIYDERFLSRPWKDRNHRQGMALPRCLSGSWGADFYEIKPQPGDLVVQKHRYSAFIETELETILRARGIETLVTTGIASNVCVESTARDGFMKDYYIVFPEDASATTSAEAHEATLRNIRDYFGVVVPAAEVIGTWSRLGGARPRP
jgi:ureidoacrylate peracid hydrolase